MRSQLILVTGANGYVGSRLANKLISLDYKVRCMSRTLHDGDISLIPKAEWIKADAFKPDTLVDAMKNVDTAYYLIHSMGSNKEFASLDREAAFNFALSASKANVKRIIYLGGLGEQKDNLSSHLQSRHEVGNLLRKSSSQVIEFRASIIIGSGSISFELVRGLVEKLPIMITPKWIYIKTQPIYIDDVIEYLVQASSININGNKIFEIGGDEELSYGDLMKYYARQRGLKRLMIPLPLLTPNISSLWLSLVTPLYARIGRKLIASLVNKTTVVDQSAKNYFNIKPISIDKAIKKAIEEEKQEYLNIHWYNVDSMVSYNKIYHNVISYGHRLYHIEKALCKAPPHILFNIITKIGGEHGFFYANFLWRLRAIIDKIIGGVGMRKGRRNLHELHVGDTIDFWRVEKLIPNKILILYAEMRLPGRAWLQFELVDKDEGLFLYQTAIFDPKGLWGIIYWYMLMPIHYIIFKGMIRAIINQAENITI